MPFPPKGSAMPGMPMMGEGMPPIPAKKSKKPARGKSKKSPRSRQAALDAVAKREKELGVKL